MVDAAVGDGAKVVAGGNIMDRPGYFYEPTVLRCESDDFDIVREEQFGPAIPVIPFDAELDAVASANRGPYGLGGSVWTNDFERGAALARRLDSGMRWINSHKGVDPSLPFGGSKSSGIGVERGIWGLNCLTELRSVSGIRKTAARPPSEA